mgnify:CR=1 FL=1
MKYIGISVDWIHEGYLFIHYSCDSHVCPKCEFVMSTVCHHSHIDLTCRGYSSFDLEESTKLTGKVTFSYAISKIGSETNLNSSLFNRS